MTRYSAKWIGGTNESIQPRKQAAVFQPPCESGRKCKGPEQEPQAKEGEEVKTVFYFEIPGEPKGKARPRFTRTGHTYTPEQTTNYENLVKVCFRQAYPNVEPIAAGIPIRAELRLYFPIPQSISKKKRELMSKGQVWHTKKCDIDNAAKIIFDALNLLAYRDDAQICELHAVKLYSDTPRVEVELWEVKVE